MNTKEVTDRVSEQLLQLSKRFLSLSITGIHYAEDSYNAERYRELKELSLQLMGLVTDTSVEVLSKLFAVEQGYQTPKIDIRALVLKDDCVLLTQERSDGKWTLPGGFAEVNLSPREVAEKEVREETGLEVRACRVLAVLDTNKHLFPPLEHHFYKIVILCEFMGGSLRGSSETLGAQFFPWDDFPELSLKRNTPGMMQLVRRCFEEQTTYVD